ncbi:Bug family tripartite tricarboxylate transporter substrate binding protein [Ramlibacter rhizophilus]|uniref:Tripartite tricarboxylate transporter substrate binding protein n=1 Tax=Ramlibacter rhizophilus TaxID=1781167 RepID=A0A4Z0BEP6_9BURK|nr:tripartite tricarboxylate transporter substrate binding protein [Ramlibacter rhizophilus]TFY96797.1 tripartite tricarboxylate transporter substrate binding protein [Ramlibacter rhizophilus]
MRRTFLLQTLAASLALAAAPAFAQANFPSKPIRFIVPYPAGGGTDYVARLIGERLSKRLGQPVLVENKSGAAGAIGVAEVAKAEPDGHTVLITINDPLVNNVALFKSLPYDPQKDLAFVAQIVRSPALISAGTQLGVKSMDDLRQLAQRGGGKLSYASWGIGGLGHLAGESLNRELKAQMVHVPQRGEGPVVQDLLANTVSVGLSSVGTAKQHVAAGKIVPLGVMNHQRMSAMPNVPTLKELGFKDPLYETSVWMAALVPARTPAPVVRKLSEEIRAIAATPEVTALLVDRGLEMHLTTPEQATANYRAEFDIITKRIRDLGIEPQ